ncbi:MAG TPA: MSHA biogenesis protein MshK [Burkholderiales bacterium]
MNPLRLLILIGFAFGANSVHAQALNDPMRPPLFTAAETPAKAGPVLQTIVIGKERRYAIISGERIAPGGAYGDAKVVRIAENEVTLRDATGDTVLKLVPQIKKQIAAPKLVSRDAVPGERGKQ